MHSLSNESFCAVNWINPYTKFFNRYENILELGILGEIIECKAFIINRDFSFVVDSFLSDDFEVREELS